MKYLHEYRDAGAARRCAEAIDQITTRPWSLMEICGGQTHAVIRFGLDEMLPDKITLIHGPGCPMCAHAARVAPQYLDSLLYQHTTDRAYRERFRDGGGFCGRHVRAAVVADTTGNGDGVGGGICQVSTTAFRAAFLGGYRIIERNSHAYRVGY